MKPKIRIKKTTLYLIESRGINIGDEFKVITEGVSDSNDRKEKRFYMIESKNGKPTIIYFDEAELIVKKSKKVLE